MAAQAGNCGDPTPTIAADCAALADVVSAEDNLRTASTVSLVSAAVGIAGGAVLYFALPPSSSTYSRPGAIRVTPTVGPTSAGWTVAGAF